MQLHLDVDIPLSNIQKVEEKDCTVYIAEGTRICVFPSSMKIESKDVNMQYKLHESALQSVTNQLETLIAAQPSLFYADTSSVVDVVDVFHAGTSDSDTLNDLLVQYYSLRPIVDEKAIGACDSLHCLRLMLEDNELLIEIE